MSTVKLTAKEVDYISNLLTQESTACKKARLYAKTLTDPTVTQIFESVAEHHQKRFNSLLNMIS